VGSNLTGGHNRLSCPRSAVTALKPYLTWVLNTTSFKHLQDRSSTTAYIVNC